MASVHLTVTGMTCGHCQKKVQSALEGVDGVYSAYVDLPGGFADVDYDASRTDAAALVAAVAAVGYGATEGD